jgi:hypothetical protein
VATGEDEPEAIVWYGLCVVHLALLVSREEEGGLRVAVVARRLAPEAIERPALGCGHDPAASVGRHPLRRPALHRRDEGFLDCLLGDVDVAEEAGQCGDNLSGFVAEDCLDRLGRRHGSGYGIRDVPEELFYCRIVILEGRNLDRVPAGGS